MSYPITMWYKSANVDVDVYETSINDKNCLVYNPQLAGHQGGNGWITVPRKNLIPYPYAEIYKIPSMSKTKYNKAKSHLHLKEAIWEATDGKLFDHSIIDEAVNYQMKLDEMEENNTDGI